MAAPALPNTQPKDRLACAGSKSSYKSSVCSVPGTMIAQPVTHGDGLVKPRYDYPSALQLK